ncbi:MAG: trypsin-like peptidase domain-containing protein [Sphingobacteriaceae bacterium]|jgi:hypothetical protein|nr:MAG: serine protease [Pedobacter sp.]
MFVEAIEKVDLFTRPIHTISRTYGGLVTPGSATLFFVNDEGVAVTCKHVLNVIAQADGINKHYAQFRTERDTLPRDTYLKKKLRELEFKYKFNNDTLIQTKNNFINTFDLISDIQCHAHPTLDLAILVFKGFSKKYYQGYATFLKDTSRIKQGRYLCRLGYPFPEFNNFEYNTGRDDIEWTNKGNPNSPRFPLDGIITRFVGTEQHQLTAIEMSTPGLRGQSGGPLFDRDGIIYGMQHQTSHLHLGFDMKDKEIIQDGKRTKVSNYPFLHVGHCIHVDRIKDFLREHDIKYYES